MCTRFLLNVVLVLVILHDALQITGYCDEIVSNEELSPKELANQAIIAIESGNWVTGKAYLEIAIHNNPNDIGSSYEPRLIIRDGDCSWGKLQLNRMLNDRPAMLKHINKGDNLWVWACHRFEGDDIHSPIKWDPKEPLATTGLNFPATDREKGRIQISSTYIKGRRKRVARSFEEMWMTAIFELHNVGRGPSFNRLRRLARQGDISKTAYVKSFYEFEFLASQETRAFYAKFFLPWASEKKLQTNPRLWYVRNQWGTFQDNFDKLQNRAEYPWIPYGVYYDLLSGANTEEALQILQEIGVLDYSLELDR